MPGFPTKIVGTPTKRGKARRYEGKEWGRQVTDSRVFLRAKWTAQPASLKLAI